MTAWYLHALTYYQQSGLGIGKREALSEPGSRFAFSFVLIGFLSLVPGFGFPGTLVLIAFRLQAQLLVLLGIRTCCNVLIPLLCLDRLRLLSLTLAIAPTRSVVSGPQTHALSASNCDVPFFATFGLLFLHPPFRLLQPRLIITHFATFSSLQHFTPAFLLLDLLPLLIRHLGQFRLLSMEMSQRLSRVGNRLELSVRLGSPYGWQRNRWEGHI